LWATSGQRNIPYLEPDNVIFANKPKMLRLKNPQENHQTTRTVHQTYITQYSITRNILSIPLMPFGFLV